MKVLVITGYPGNERIREIRDLGFDRILPKPFGMPAFLAAVGKPSWIRSRHRDSEARLA